MLFVESPVSSTFQVGQLLPLAVISSIATAQREQSNYCLLLLASNGHMESYIEPPNNP